MNMFQRNVIISAAGLIGFLGILGAAYCWYMGEQGNFHPITPGEAYRSAQMDPDELRYYIDKFKIRSVINLRGKNPGASWYRKEIATCRKLGTRHYDLGLSADNPPKPQAVRELLRIFRKAQRPVLIHCQGGADRSGLAAALWKMVIDGSPKALAREQLSIRFGHLPFGPTHVLDVYLDKWPTPERANGSGKKMADKSYKSEVAAADPQTKLP